MLTYKLCCIKKEVLNVCVSIGKFYFYKMFFFLFYRVTENMMPESPFKTYMLTCFSYRGKICNK